MTEIKRTEEEIKAEESIHNVISLFNFYCSNFNSALLKTTNNVFWGKKLVGANNLSESWPSLKYGLVKR